MSRARLDGQKKKKEKIEQGYFESSKIIVVDY